MDKDKNSSSFFNGAPDSFEDFMNLSPGFIPEASLNSADRATLGVVNNLSIEQLRDMHDGVIPVYVLAEWLASRLPDKKSDKPPYLFE